MSNKRKANQEEITTFANLIKQTWRCLPGLGTLDDVLDFLQPQIGKNAPHDLMEQAASKLYNDKDFSNWGIWEDGNVFFATQCREKFYDGHAKNAACTLEDITYQIGKHEELARAEGYKKSRLAEMQRLGDMLEGTLEAWLESCGKVSK